METTAMAEKMKMAPAIEDPVERGHALMLEQILPSPTNPRKHYDQEALDELTANVRAHGVLQPVLVRPLPASRTPPKVKDVAAGSFYELVVGERRFRAAKAAGHSAIPVIIRHLGDDQVLEIQLVENLQRQDLHALEEAECYRKLMSKGYDVARIAAQTGRSVRYVYDRVKLLSLTKEAQKAFREGRFTTGHAVVLARLSPADQKRAMGTDDSDDWYGGNRSGLWQEERTLFDPENDETHIESLKPVSVRELEAWVDKHVKLEAAEADPMLFPDLVAAAETHQKVLRVTHEQMTPEEAKEGPRPILGRSWKRADGQRGSKECEHSVTGSVVIGPNRGWVGKVCVDKKHCTVHWGDVIKAAKKREREVAKGGATGEAREAIRRKKAAEEVARRKVELDRWTAARPAILAALAAKVRAAPAGFSSHLGRRVLEVMRDALYVEPKDKALALVPPGKTGDDLIRHLAFQDFITESMANEYFHGELKREMQHFADAARALGVDVWKLFEAAAPEEPKPKDRKPTSKGRKA